MGDSRRFHEFAKRIKKQFLPTNNIADVAGGKGYMRLALKEQGLNYVTTWDKRHSYIAKNVGTQKYSYFLHDRVVEKYEGVIGMHPDGATDKIIYYCGKNRVKGLICPCCVISSAEVYWGRSKYLDWKKHLTKMANRLNLEVQWTTMPFQGRNDLMIISP